MGGNYGKEENKLRDDLLAEVQENIQRRKACPLHQFEGKKKVAIGEKHVCLNCGSKFYISDIGKYVDGYIAAGGNPDDIYEGLGRPQPTRPQPAIEGDVVERVADVLSQKMPSVDADDEDDWQLCCDVAKLAIAAMQSTPDYERGKLQAIKERLILSDGWEDGETFYKSTVECIREIIEGGGDAD